MNEKESEKFLRKYFGVKTKEIKTTAISAILDPIEKQLFTCYRCLGKAASLRGLQFHFRSHTMKCCVNYCEANDDEDESDKDPFGGYDEEDSYEESL